MTDRHWFTPKTHGYGAYPRNWKGWAAILAYGAAMVGGSILVLSTGGGPPTGERIMLWIASMSALTIGFVWLSRAKTNGEWRWRWDRSRPWWQFGPK